MSRASFYRYDEDAAPRPGSRHGPARCHPAWIALEWPSYGRHADHGRAPPGRVDRQSQTGLPVASVKTNPAMHSEAEVRWSPPDSNQRPTGLSELGGRDDAQRHQPALGGRDITYIRLEAEFIYLAVVIDAFSRRVIGWALDRRVEDDLTLAALHMALELQAAGGGVGASFRSWQPVCIGRLHGPVEGPRLLKSTHEPQGESLGKWRLRVVDENSEMRRGVSARIPRPGRSARLRWDALSIRSITRSDCTRRWVTGRRWSSSKRWGHPAARGLDHSDAATQ